MSKKAERVEVEFTIGLKAYSRGRFAEEFCDKVFSMVAASLQSQHHTWKISYKKRVKK